MIPITTNQSFGKSATAVVMIHGYGGSREQWTGLMQDLDRQKIGALSFALPAHEKNPERDCGFGTKEVDDAVAMIRLAKKNGAKRVTLLGVSLGGYIAWQAAEREPVDGIVTEATFPNFSVAIERWFKRFGPVAPLLKPAIPLAQLRTGVQIPTFSADSAAEHWKGRPCAILHGDKDELFPLSFGESLAKAADTPLVVLKGATHANGYKADRSLYLQTVLNVVRRSQN